MSLPTNDCCFPCLFFQYAKQVHLCVTCRACLDVRLNVYMTRIGLQIDLATISLKHEYSNSLNLKYIGDMLLIALANLQTF